MRKQSGFTLMEVLLALTVLISSAYIFSNLQIRANLRSRKITEEVFRVFLIKKELYKQWLNSSQKEKPIVINKETPQTKITSHKEDINKKSSLKDFIKDIDIIYAEGTWSVLEKPVSSKMISFALKPPKKENS